MFYRIKSTQTSKNYTIMPRRETRRAEMEKFEYGYEELLRYLAKKIKEEYGSITEFVNSDDCRSFGLGRTSADKRKMFTYLTIPAEGKKAKVKSFPVVKKLYSRLLNIELEAKIEVVRTQKIFSLEAIEEI